MDPIIVEYTRPISCVEFQKVRLTWDYATSTWREEIIGRGEFVMIPKTTFEFKEVMYV